MQFLLEIGFSCKCFSADFIQDCIGERWTTGSKDGPEGSHGAAWDGWLLGPGAASRVQPVLTCWHCSKCCMQCVAWCHCSCIWQWTQCTDPGTWPHRSEAFGPEGSLQLQQFQLFHTQTQTYPPEPLAEKEMHLIFNLPLFLEVVFYSLHPSS